MKTKYLFEPIVLFLIPSIFAVLVWWVTPLEWLNDWKVLYKVELVNVLLPWAVAFTVFAFGCFIRRCTYAPKMERAPQPQARAQKQQWATFLIASISMALLFFFVIKEAGISGILQTYTLRDNYVGGVTTFILLSTAGLVLAGSNFIIDGNSSRIAMIPLVGMLAYAFYRGVVGSERIAFIIPAVALAVIWVLRKIKAVSFKLIFLLVLGLLTLVVVFTMAEYFRSYSEKLDLGENINANIWEYGVQRFFLYFSTSVNSGGAQFGFFNTGVSYNPVFMTTFSPLAKILYSIVHLPPILLGPYSGDTADIAVNMGYYNPEFNNHWGVATAFTEGWVIGIIFWFIWGFWGTHMYLNITKREGDAWDWAFYGLFVAAFIDNQSRVALLAAPHFQVPFLWLYFIYFLRPKDSLYKTGGRVKPGLIPSPNR